MEPVKAHRGGLIREMMIVSGDEVRLGQPLIGLTDRQVEEELRLATELVEQLELELSTAEAEARLNQTWRRRQIENDVMEVQQKAAGFLKEKFDWELQRSMLADVLRRGDIAAAGPGEVSVTGVEPEVFGSMINERLSGIEQMNTMMRIEFVNNAIDVADAQVELCNDRVAELEALEESLPDLVDEAAGVNVIRARLTHAQAALEALQATQNSELALHSPAYGTVGTIRKETGDRLEPGDVLFELLDHARRHVDVEAPSMSVQDFPLGTIVQLTFPGDIVREGEVVGVAAQAERRNVDDPGSDPIVRVRVEQVGELWPQVPIGCRINVTLHD